MSDTIEVPDGADKQGTEYLLESLDERTASDIYALLGTRAEQLESVCEEYEESVPDHESQEEYQQLRSRQARFRMIRGALAEFRGPEVRGESDGKCELTDARE